MSGITVASCESTSQLAREQGLGGAPHGFYVSAEEQSAGRGRWGRQWQSLRGNLFLSVVLRPTSNRHWTWIPMASALVTLEALQARRHETELKLKWPNDLWLDGKKLAGLLCESVSVAGAEPFLILGLGLNVTYAPQGLDQQTSAWGESGAHVLHELREGLSQRIAEATQRLEREGPSWVEELFWTHSQFPRGSWVSWQQGSVTQSGIIQSLGPFGELRVEIDGKLSSLYSEEIKEFRSAGG